MQTSAIILLQVADQSGSGELVKLCCILCVVGFKECSFLYTLRSTGVYEKTEGQQNQEKYHSTS